MNGAAAVALWAVAAGVCTAENWPQFRGPRGDGTSGETFAAPKRTQWKLRLPGPGHSSPIVWGDRIFLTAFERETSTLRQLAGIQGRLLVLCVNRKSGRLEWRREVRAGSIEKTTNVNKPASPTPATDGSRVYAYFGSFGVAAFTLDGRPVWERALGPYPHHMGRGSSPVLDGGSLILNAEISIAAGPRFEARGQWGGFGRLMASPAISGGAMYLRSDSHLHALLP